jgi:hypothetical protein
MAPDRAPDLNGWYTAPVTWHTTCTDALSGIATCSPDQTLTTDGSSTVTGTGTDVADNMTSVAAHANLDRLAPTGAISDPLLSLPILGQKLTGTARDAASGVANVSVAYSDARGVVRTYPATVTCDALAHNCTWQAPVPAVLIGAFTVRATITDYVGHTYTTAPRGILVVL